MVRCFKKCDWEGLKDVLVMAVYNDIWVNYSFGYPQWFCSSPKGLLYKDSKRLTSWFSDPVFFQT